MPVSCPCDPRAKQWVEERLEWIRGRFGSTIFGDHLLLYPTEDFFPEEEDPQDLFWRVGGYMGVGLERLGRVREDSLPSPHDRIPTFAREVARLRLSGKTHADDDELLVDLTAFALGYAIFLANAPRPDGMTLPMLGYALAHVAWFQKQERPSWEKYLGSASRSAFRQGVRFLFATGDTKFRPRPRALDEIVRLFESMP